MEVRRDDGYEISTDKARLDVAYIHRYLSEESYWARGRTPDTVEKAIANSLCFGVFWGAEQVGFARVVTDCATFGWLCDVFVDERHRGRGWASGWWKPWWPTPTWRTSRAPAGDE